MYTDIVCSFYLHTCMHLHCSQVTSQPGSSCYFITWKLQAYSWNSNISVYNTSLKLHQCSQNLTHTVLSMFTYVHISTTLYTISSIFHSSCSILAFTYCIHSVWRSLDFCHCLFCILLEYSIWNNSTILFKCNLLY